MGLSGGTGFVYAKISPQNPGCPEWPLSLLNSFQGVCRCLPLLPGTLGNSNTFPHHLPPGTLDPSRSDHHPYLASGGKLVQTLPSTVDIV